jgi:hypothetical protein
MKKLSQTLRQAGLDTTSLRLFFTIDEEKIYRLAVSGGTQAVAIWQQLRDIVPQTDRWPVLLGDMEELERIQENLEDFEDQATADLLQEAEAIDPLVWLAERHQDLIERLEKARDFTAPGSEKPASAFPVEQLLAQEKAFRGIPRGTWPSGDRAAHEFSIPFDMSSHKPLRRVYIGLVPTDIDWQVPAFLKFGGFNRCPEPSEHVALLRHWEELYDAELVGMTRSVIEMSVARPPTTRKEALELAKQHYLYCPDTVDQGTKTLDALAATLLGGTVWSFWWD